MSMSDFSLFRHDPLLPSLRSLDIDGLRDQLDQAIPGGHLDAPLAHYEACNMRYAPRRKLVVGLTAPNSAMPIGIRIFPPGQLDARYRKALDSGATHVYRLPASSALAWAFPSERKLDLRIISDRAALTQLWLAHRQLHLHQMELMHFVPEQAYTIRLHGQLAASHLHSDAAESQTPVCEYLKISYDNSGELAAERTRILAAQCIDLPIRIAADTCYLPHFRLMFQSALDPVEGSRLSTREVAVALASFHALTLPSSICNEHATTVAARTMRTRDLLVAVFPELVARFDALSYRLVNATKADDSPQVLLHGDAHPGNLLRLCDGRIGIIDLDQVHRGPAADDLANFYAFLLCKDLSGRHEIGSLLTGFDDFIDAYNGHSAQAVTRATALQALALHLCTVRIARGIARGKVRDSDELVTFMEVAEQALLHMRG